jgi:Protein of unknown function (DUF2750)
MLQDSATSKENCDRFVLRVRESGTVYGLRTPVGGWAVCPSHDTAGADVFVFWSDRAYAARHQKEGWKGYEPTPIPLGEFIDAWLKGMHDNGSLVGPNWDANLCGVELAPSELAERLIENEKSA